MNHSFDVEIATRYGVNCAVLLQHIYYWTEKNKANGKHFYDGLYWTYNSAKAYSIMFPYLSEKQTAYALKKLEDEGLIATGNYNTNKYDHTKWYGITKKGYSILQKVEIEETKGSNLYTDINTDIKPNINKSMGAKPQTARFSVPTVEEVAAYIQEQGYSIDAQHFCDYYASNGWRVGKSRMKDWRATVRNWARRDKPKETAALKYESLQEGLI